MEVRLKNLKKFYGKKNILDIKDLSFKKGKITGVLGENGCGKTTLMNMISGIDREFEGQILYSEKSFDESLYKDITMVFQNAKILNRSVIENILYPLKLRGYEKQEMKKLTLEILSRLEIEDLKDKNGRNLSGGERQKVALARALVFKPKILLLDEFTSNVDFNSTKILEREIKEFNKNNDSTIIIVTHDKNQANRLCDEIVNI